MAYLYIIVAVFAFYAAIHRFTELDTKQKVAGSVAFLLIVLAIVWFESRSDKQRELVHQMSFAFEHNQTLICQEATQVHKETFNYSVGGHSFLGKAGTKVEGMIVPISTCSKIKE